jgi:methyl-accepting chemotaxis protein
MARITGWCCYRQVRRKDAPAGHQACRDVPGRSWSSAAGTVFAALLASLLFGAILARYLSKPIHLMSEAFQSVAKGEMDVNLAGKMGGRRDELADLGRDFDSLAQAAEAADHRPAPSVS